MIKRFVIYYKARLDFPVRPEIGKIYALRNEETHFRPLKPGLTESYLKDSILAERPEGQ